MNELEQHGVKYSGRYESTWVTTLLSWVVPIVIFFGIWSLIFRRMSPGWHGDDYRAEQGENLWRE